MIVISFNGASAAGVKLSVKEADERKCSWFFSFNAIGCGVYLTSGIFVYIACSGRKEVFHMYVGTHCFWNLRLIWGIFAVYA